MNLPHVKRLSLLLHHLGSRHKQTLSGDKKKILAYKLGVYLPKRIELNLRRIAKCKNAMFKKVTKIIFPKTSASYIKVIFPLKNLFPNIFSIFLLLPRFLGNIYLCSLSPNLNEPSGQDILIFVQRRKRKYYKVSVKTFRRVSICTTIYLDYVWTNIRHPYVISCVFEYNSYLRKTTVLLLDQVAALKHAFSLKYFPIIKYEYEIINILAILCISLQIQQVQAQFDYNLTP